MITPQRKLVGGMLVVTAACLVSAFASNAQTPRPAGTAPATSAPASQASMDAERAAIWNSPNMLRARAWLQEYCATSAKVKPGEAQQYLDELEHMSPVQMKLWLMKFDEEEDQKQQQNAFWKQAQSTALGQAKAADRATQKSYAAIESEETAAANQEQGQLNEERANEQQMQDDKQLGPYTPYGQGYYPGAGGGVHYHFHVYPN
jgi:hypothetical protein